jgi:hypothetical protein
MCKAILTILEKGTRLSLAEKSLNSAATILSLNKGVDFVEGPKAQFLV